MEVRGGTETNMGNLNLCAMTFSKAFEGGRRISCFFTFAYHVLIPNFSFFLTFPRPGWKRRNAS